MMRELIAAGSNVNVNISGLKDPSTSVLIIIVLTVLAIAPSVLVLMTAFPASSSSCRSPGTPWGRRRCLPIRCWPAWR